MTIEEAARRWAQAEAEKRRARERFQNWPREVGLDPGMDVEDEHNRRYGWAERVRCYQADLDMSEWCEVCRRRQPIYRDYRRAINRESGARRRLFRLASTKETP